MLQHNKIHNFFKQAGWKQTYIKVLDLDEYNFLVYVFFIWNHLRSQNSIWSSHILNFIFCELYKQHQVKKMIKRKIVALNVIYNIVVDNIFIGNQLGYQICIGSSKISQFKISNVLRWKIDQNERHSSRWELQFCSWWPFHLKIFEVPKVWLKFAHFEIQIVQTTSDGETTNIKVIDLD